MKMKKFNFSKKLLSIGTIFLLGLGLANSLQSTNQLTTIDQNDNIKVLSLSPDTLNSDIDSLDVWVNLDEQLFNYDINFKTNDFDNQTVKSFIFHNPTLVETEWERYDLSKGVKIQNKHASNSVSYKVIFDDGFETSVSDQDCSVQFGIEYGTENFATNFPIKLELKATSENMLYDLINNQTSLNLNDEMTYAQLSFNMEYNTDRLKINSVYLKSKNNSDVNIDLFNGGKANLIQGTNNFTLKLEEDYDYSELFLQFTFNDKKSSEKEVRYYIDADFNSSSDTTFHSGITPKSKIEWGTKEIISFSFIILFIIIVLILFVVILLQIKKRKRLEDEQAEEYYNQNLL